MPTNSVFSTKHYNGERCSGGKYSKVRLTELASGNAAGEKLPLFMIGMSAKPHCFSRVKRLSCRYRSQKRARWIGICLLYG